MKNRKEVGIGMVEVMVVGVLLTAIAASATLFFGQQSKHYNATQIVANRDMLFQALVRAIQSDSNVRHSLDNGTLYPAGGANKEANRNDTRSPGNEQLSKCIHPPGPCNPQGNAQIQKVVLPDGNNVWVPFVLVRVAGPADSNGVMSFKAVAGTEAAPIRYDLQGQLCSTGNPGVPTAECPFEAISYGRVNCGTSCNPADSLAFTVVLRHGLVDGKPVPLPKGLFAGTGNAGEPSGIAPKVLGTEINYSRQMLSTPPVISGMCDDATIEGVRTQQRVIGVGTNGELMCAPVQACPVGTVYATSAPNGAPVCEARKEDRCGTNSIVVGTDRFGKVICTGDVSSKCFNTQTSTCPEGSIKTSEIPICATAGGGKKGGGGTNCSVITTCCSNI